MRSRRPVNRRSRRSIGPSTAPSSGGGGLGAPPPPPRGRQAGEPAQSAIDRAVDSSVQWRVAFDAAAQPSVSHVTGFSREPVVDVRVRNLLANERDQVSTQLLRNLVVPYDQLAEEARQQEA